MDGTRTARIAAITAAVALAAALTVATLLTTNTRDGIGAGRAPTSLTERAPVFVRSAERRTTDVVVPRTTPPPTLPAPEPGPVRTVAAETAEQP